MTRIEIIVKVTDNCNIDCDYCFDKQRRKKKNVINTETISGLHDFISKLTKVYDEIDIIFHGGEPLTVPPQTFLAIIEAIEDLPVNCHIQTNLAISNIQMFTEVLQKINGLSFTLDGPQSLHDSQRYNSDKSGSYDLVMTNLEWLRSNHPDLELGVLCTMSQNSVVYSRQLYSYFKKIGVNKIGINPVFDETKGISNDDYCKCLEDMFEEWFLDPNPLDISLFVEALKWVTQIQESPNFCYGMDCFRSIYSISPDGYVSPCLHWQGDGNFNIRKFDSTSYLDFYSYKFRSNNRKECKECPVYTFCKGGCSHEYQNNEWKFCASMKKFITLVQTRVRSFTTLQREPV